MDNHPKKDHALHLRSIQFTMLLFSVALLAAVFLDTNTALSRAHKQAQSVSAAMVRPWRPSFVWDHAKRYVRDPGLPNDALTSNLEWRYRLKSDWSAWTAEAGVRTWVFAAPDETSLHVFNRQKERLARPTTLTEFISLWNLLQGSQLRYVTAGMAKGVVTSYDDKVRLSHERLDGEGEPITFEFADIEIRESESISPNATGREKRSRGASMRLIYATPSKSEAEAGLGMYKHALSVSPPDTAFKLLIPCTYRVLPVDAQKLLGRMVDQEWPSGRFETSFAELAKAAKEYGNLGFPTLERVLFNELSRESRFNIIGVNFPAAAAATWGVPLLIVVQIYFLIHLVRFELSDSDRPNVPWIGLYPSPLARVVFALVSVFVVPVVTISVFASQFEGISMRIVGLGFSCLVSLSVAGKIWSQLSFFRPSAKGQTTACCDDQT